LRQQVLQLEAQERVQLKMLEAMQISEQKHRILLNESSDPIFAFDNEGHYLYVNQAFADGVGKKLEHIIHKKIWDVFPTDEADKRYATVKWVFENRATRIFEGRVPRADGDRYYITTAKPVFGGQGTVIMVICISKDITERKQMEEELLRLSTHDLLTGLYNRNFYEVELERLQISRLFPVSIVIADMDNLKSVNDRFGHSAGDILIQRVALYLRQAFRAEDIIARIGGDEYAVLLPQTPESAATMAVERLRGVLADDRDPLLKISIGLATGEEGSRLHYVMRLADDRMYHEKLAHKKAASES
jgi:diguanylate cyclase (GGDEF)-like protein/PAS domain S-box-containing protein